MRTRIGCYAVVVDQGSILLAHWSENGQSGWTLPGGGMEVGESAEQTAVREVSEETGLDVELTGLLGLDSLYLELPDDEDADEPFHSFRVLFTGAVLGGRLRDEIGGSTDRAEWFPLDQIPDDRVTLIDRALELLSQSR